MGHHISKPDSIIMAEAMAAPTPGPSLKGLMASETPWQDWAEKMRAERLTAMTPEEREALKAFDEKTKQKLLAAFREAGLLDG